MSDEPRTPFASATGPMGERGTITATLRDVTANPGPLGLMAFGMTTVLLNIHNAGFYEMNTMILAMGIFYGGIAQVIAGIMEWKKNSTFGMTAFLSYGLFWLTLVGLIVFPKWMGVDGPDDVAMGWYLMAWGVFTGLMFIGTLRINRSLQVVFFTLTILFVLLAVGDWTGNATITKIAGWEGIFVGLSAVYGSIAQVWNELYGKVVLPIGPYKQVRPTAAAVTAASRRRGAPPPQGGGAPRASGPVVSARPPHAPFFRPRPSLSCSLTRTRVRSTLHTNTCSPQEEERWKVSHRDRNRYWSSSARACASTGIRPRCARSARASICPRRPPCTRTWPTWSAWASSGAIPPSRARSTWSRTCGRSGRCRWSAASPPARRSSPRTTSRSSSTFPASSVATTATSCSASAATP